MNRISNLFAFERKTWRINPNSLNYKVYQWWLDNTNSDKVPYTSGYREDFCHYWRVVLLWSPLMWFFVVPMFRFGRFDWVRPWMVTTVLMLCALVAYGILFSPVTLGILAILGIIAVFLLLAIAIVLGVHLIIESDRTERAVTWFFTSHKFFIVYPWSVTLVTLVTLSCLTLGVETTWEVLRFTGILIVGLLGFFAVALIVVGIAYGVVGLVKTGWGLLTHSGRYAPARSAQRRASRPQERGISTVGLFVRALWAQHNRICPLVEFPDTENAEW